MSESIYDITLHPAGPCKHCGGTGKIVLLTSSRTCGFCCGSGKIGELSEYRHRADAQPKELAGLPAMTVQTGCVVTETYYYEDEQENIIGLKTYTQQDNGTWRLTDSQGKVE
jgi:hypothetical protein